jgi:hypothetical protein
MVRAKEHSSWLEPTQGTLSQYTTTLLARIQRNEQDAESELPIIPASSPPRFSQQYPRRSPVPGSADTSPVPDSTAASPVPDTAGNEAFDEMYDLSQESQESQEL